MVKININNNNNSNLLYLQQSAHLTMYDLKKQNKKGSDSSGAKLDNQLPLISSREFF